MESPIKKSVLTVDDSSTIRQMVCFTLREAGFDVLEAVDGKDAIDKMNMIKFDLIITDLNMPNLDGIELIRHARTDPIYRFVPILMLTTESQQEKKVLGKCAGATGWITKPFKPDQLVSVVKRVI